MLNKNAKANIGLRIKTIIKKQLLNAAGRQH